ncbi:cysteine hydrolase family protein [Paenibacillus lutrae]|uniref:Isochorismatase family protein n=1 Tax=Paenibacillus lutrae TaxID=2078573 RepID=A0A7X3FJ35_9BACL|nr:isochorismatase family cysteine hydrolase [Paenibacillus lutrae]MVP00585.1 isochorismatase family protein [Paenibacillus lutrae]
MNKYTAPNWTSSALITIDTQNDFTQPDAPARIAGTAEVLPYMQQLLQAYREANLPIIHVIRLYQTDGANVDICRKELIENGGVIAAPGTDGAELVPEIKPQEAPHLASDILLQGEFQQIGPNEWVMYKPRWGAFYGTDLEAFLREKNVDTLVFSGCNFPNCPRTTMYEASERDFRVVMVPNAISGVYELGITELSRIGIVMLPTNEVVNEVAGVAAPL